jgi:hypothetical protein
MLRSWASLAVIGLGAALASVSISAQGIKDIPPGYKQFNHGREWNSWSNEFRSIYLAGFIDGGGSTFREVLTDLPPERREPLRLQTATLFEADAIRDVMTSLYSDPANTYIPYDSMVYIARDKLSGKDIEQTVRNRRSHGPWTLIPR